MSEVNRFTYWTRWDGKFHTLIFLFLLMGLVIFLRSPFHWGLSIGILMSMFVIDKVLIPGLRQVDDRAGIDAYTEGYNAAQRLGRH